MAYYLNYEWIDKDTGDDVIISLKFEDEATYNAAKQDIEASGYNEDVIYKFERMYSQ